VWTPILLLLSLRNTVMGSGENADDLPVGRLFRFLLVLAHSCWSVPVVAGSCRPLSALVGPCRSKKTYVSANNRVTFSDPRFLRFFCVAMKPVPRVRSKPGLAVSYSHVKPFAPSRDSGQPKHRLLTSPPGAANAEQHARPSSIGMYCKSHTKPATTHELRRKIIVRNKLG
jgi:hypothetical protein